MHERNTEPYVVSSRHEGATLETPPPFVSGGAPRHAHCRAMAPHSAEGFAGAGPLSQCQRPNRRGPPLDAALRTCRREREPQSAGLLAGLCRRDYSFRSALNGRLSRPQKTPPRPPARRVLSALSSQGSAVHPDSRPKVEYPSDGAVRWNPFENTPGSCPRRVSQAVRFQMRSRKIPRLVPPTPPRRLRLRLLRKSRSGGGCTACRPSGAATLGCAPPSRHAVPLRLRLCNLCAYF